MSKASDWAARSDAVRKESDSVLADRPKVLGKMAGTIGRVTEGGSVHIPNTTLSAEDALTLAHWIIDTFGEPTDKAGA